MNQAHFYDFSGLIYWANIDSNTFSSSRALLLFVKPRFVPYNSYILPN